MSRLIDRRLDGKNKSAVNRQRFIRRFKNQMRKSVTETLKGRSITDIDNGEKVNIPARDLSEPTFGHGGGRREVVHPGNKKFVKGDKMSRPKGGSGSGSGGGQAGNSGEGEDDFVFELSREEFLELFFEDLELPNLVRTQLARMTEFTSVRAGFSPVGNPSAISITRTFRRSLSRRFAVLGARKTEIAEIEAEIQELLGIGIGTDAGDERIDVLRERIDEIRRKKPPPFIDTFDLRFVNRIQQPQPTTQAVMFCIMDVSGSMDRARKDLAKRFFTLLYLFLKRNYEKIDVVFIRHHESAKEVDEHEFFYGRETGGTIVSSALNLMVDIVAARYPTDRWNIYAAQASDGDNNQKEDSGVCHGILLNKIMSLVRYFAYIEITPDRHQSLWEAYEGVKKQNPNFAMRQIDGPGDIYPVFRDLFRRRIAH